MAYIPGAGLKKPLNMLETPVYPDIKKIIPETKWSRKYWQVDPGAVMRDTEHMTNFLGDAVLWQSRDYNRNVYGQDSFRSTVNSTFRPPLIDPIEDLVPLTRIPTKVHAIVPRLNPSTVGETNGYLARNNHNDDVKKALTDKIKTGQVRPTFYCNIEMPEDNSILPDLETVIPQVSAYSGGVYPTINGPDPTVELDYKQLHAKGISGQNPQVYLDGENAKENLILGYTKPQVSTTSGTGNPYLLNGEQLLPDLEDVNPKVTTSAGVQTQVTVNGEVRSPDLRYTNPQASAHSGVNTPFQAEIETSIENLKYTNPQVSATSGIDPVFKAEVETSTAELNYTRPQTSATSGVDPGFQISGTNANEDLELETKLDNPLFIANPGSDQGYKEQLYDDQGEQTVRSSRPNYSYAVSKKYQYRDRNDLDYRPHFRERLQTEKTYGQISQASPIIPTKFQPQPFSLKEKNIRPSKKKYKF